MHSLGTRDPTCNIAITGDIRWKLLLIKLHLLILKLEMDRITIHFRFNCLSLKDKAIENKMRLLNMSKQVISF